MDVLRELQTALVVPVVVASIGVLIALRSLASEGLPAFLRPAYARAGE